MSGKITRRQLVGVAAGSAAVTLVAVNASAQTPATAQDWDKAARDSHNANSATLAMFEIPMTLEPAFQFKA